jgi:hypothetical protein
VHAAPPVRVSLGRSRGWTAFVALCAGIAVANAAAWLLLQRGASVAAGAGLGLVAVAFAARRLKGEPQASDLSWSGSQWQWQGLVGEVTVALDLDAWMLLRFDPARGRRRWIVASRASAAGPWPALRAALYARRPADPLSPGVSDERAR